jgi:tetratricopeptide (TPR) repeat protein
MGRSSAAVWVLVVLLGAPRAYADPVEEQHAAQNRTLAKRHYEAGDKAFRLGDFEMAARQFRSAYELFPTPLLLWNLAQTYRQLNDHKQALFFYKQFAAADTTGAEHDSALKRIQELEEIVEKERKSQEAPPAGPTKPPTLEATPQPAPAPVVDTKKTDVPLYKKWWLWTAVGGVVAVGLAVGLGVGLTANRSSFDASLGTVGPKALVQW